MRLLILGVMLAFAQVAQAANITALPPEGNKPAIIAVEGTLEPRDGDLFTQKVGAYTNVIVVFQSDGGSVIAGLQIGKAIHQKKFSTFVPGNVRCASACALAWLGGEKRFMGNGARIGFHAAYNSDSGQESGAANALVGAYLNEIGLDYAAIFYITKAPPQSMTWLTPEDADKLGIKVTLLESPTERPKTAETPPEPRGDDRLKNRALEIITAIFRKWSESREVAWVESIYAETVSYYGAPKSRNAVVLDKLEFAERWPERRYRLRFDTFNVQCDSGNSTCKVEGIVDWQTRNTERAEQLSGTASVVYVLALRPNSFEIVAENGNVLKRESGVRNDSPRYYGNGEQSSDEEVRH